MLIDTISLLTPATGIARYTYEIALRLPKFMPQTPFCYNYGYISKKLHYSKKSNKTVDAKIVNIPLIKKAGKFILAQINRLYPYRYDLYWQPNFIPSPNIKTDCLITTIHDLSFIHYPEYHPKERVLYFEKNLPNAIENSQRIITGSHYTKKELVKELGINPQKIDVIYHAVDHDIFNASFNPKCETVKRELNLPKNYILFVGSIEPRKNLKNLLQAYVNLPKHLKKSIPLLLVGFTGWNNEEIMQIIKKEQILYLGYVDDQTLSCLYKTATLFVYPSIYEGFGIPPLEAMACGTPVIVSNSSSLPEACGDAALYIDPNDEVDLRKSIEKVLEDKNLQQQMIKKGIEHCANFTWDRSAKKHAEVFKPFIKSEKC